MHAHLSLFIVLAMTSLYTFAETYTRYRKDWCGLCLLPTIAMQLFIPTAAIALTYVELMKIAAEIPAVRPYVILASFASALVAHMVNNRALQEKWDTRIDVPITMRKTKLARDLDHHPRCREILVDSILVAELKQSTATNIIHRLHTPPSHDQIIAVINQVGLARVRSIMKGTDN